MHRGKRAIAPQELRSIPREGDDRQIGGDKGDPPAEIGMIGVPRKQHPGVGVPICNDMDLGVFALGSQRPFAVEGYG